MLLLPAEMLFILDKDIVPAKLLNDMGIGPPERYLLLFHDSIDLAEYLLGIFFQVHIRFLAELRHALKGGHTYTEELIQVIGKNTQEFQAVVDMILRILRLLQYPFVERQPANVSYQMSFNTIFGYHKNTILFRGMNLCKLPVTGLPLRVI